jgi:hypothetical protein
VDNPHADLEAAEAGSLNSSNRMMNSYLKTGQDTLQELHAQRDRLKGVGYSLPWYILRGA